MDPVTLFEPEFARRALAATLLLAVGGGLIGVSVVLRELPFFVHGVGSGAFPALVIGSALAVPAVLAGYAGAAVFAAALWLVTRGAASEPRTRDARTGLLVAASLALGALLASELAGVSSVPLSPETMLFGSVLTVTYASIVSAALVAAIAVVVVRLRGEHWLAAGFDRGAAPALGVGSGDALLLLTAALVTAAALPLTGALMAGALIVIPAATARVVTRRSGPMTLLSVAIAVAVGVLGLYLSLAFDLPAGATIAATAGGAFVVMAIAASLSRLPSRGLATAALLAALAALAGCGSGSGGVTADDGEGVPVVATTTQAADLVRQVGGEHVSVTTLLKAGADPHGFEPTPNDVAALEDARVIFRNGGDIDAWLQPAIDAGGGGRKPVDLSGGAVLLPSGVPADGRTVNDEAFNPHWSLDPDNLRSVALLVRDELIKADPERRETYRARTAAYRATVAEADDRLRRCAGAVPAGSRAVAAGHDDFVYLTEHFRIDTAALLRPAGKAEPSAADVERATKAARAGGAGAYLVSRGEASRLDRSVASALGVPLLELYGDSLAPGGERANAFGAADTALGAIGHNLGRIADALGGDPAACDLSGL